MLNLAENLLENERGPMNDQDLTKTDYDPDRGSLSFSNKFSTKFSIVSNKFYVREFLRKKKINLEKINFIANKNKSKNQEGTSKLNSQVLL
jgi:hypothetical protein